MSPRDIAAERVLEQLGTARFGKSLRVLDVTASTNDDARLDAAAGAVDGHCVIADHQTQGRGSQGRSWESPAGTDLYLSIVTRPALALHVLPKLTLAVGLGVARAVDALLQAPRTQVKWPNDIWLGDHKVAGVLVEASAVGDAVGPVIIGIGLNVNREHFGPTVTQPATSLRRARGDEGGAFDRAQVLCALLLHVERALDGFIVEGAEATIAEVDARLALRGRRVTIEGIEGVLRGLAPSGAILIETAHGIVERVAGRLLPLA